MAAKCPTCGKREVKHGTGRAPSTGYRKDGCRCCSCRAWKSAQNSTRDRSKSPVEPARVRPVTVTPERPRQAPQSAPERPVKPVRPIASRPAASPLQTSVTLPRTRESSARSVRVKQCRFSAYPVPVRGIMYCATHHCHHRPGFPPKQ